MLCSVKVSSGAQLKEDEAIRIQLFEIKFVKLFIYLQEFIGVADYFSAFEKLNSMHILSQGKKNKTCQLIGL